MRVTSDIFIGIIQLLVSIEVPFSREVRTIWPQYFCFRTSPFCGKRPEKGWTLTVVKNILIDLQTLVAL